MPSDIDMEDTQSHGFEPFDPLSLQSIEEWSITNPYTPPAPKITPLRATTKHLGEHASTFQMACDARGLKPDFDYHETAKGCFNVTLFLNGQLVDQIGVYASKRDAKEEMCRLTISKLDSFGNKKQELKTAHAESHLPSPPPGLGDEGWVNILYGTLSRY